jgi:hypothetical protein
MTLADRGRLVGFDIRRDTAGLSSLWNEERRTLFLLRRSVPSPLSVDRLVWPSVFEFSDLISHPDDSGDVVRTSPDYGRYGLWFDFDAMMRSWKGARRDAMTTAVPISVRLLASAKSELPDAFQHLASGEEAIVQSDASPQVLLGYDVADASLLSGLMNCEYDEEERRELAPAWQQRLNEHGLLTDQEASMEFSRLTDERVPEHRPFGVFALYRHK